MVSGLRFPRIVWSLIEPARGVEELRSLFRWQRPSGAQRWGNPATASNPAHNRGMHSQRRSSSLTSPKATRFSDSERAALIEAACMEYGLTPIEDLGAYTSIAVLRCTRTDGQMVILKFPDPNNPRSTGEHIALEAWSASGVTPRLFAGTASMVLSEDLGGVPLIAEHRISAAQLHQVGAALAKLHRHPAPCELQRLSALLPGMHQKVLSDPDVPVRAKALADAAYRRLMEGQMEDVIVHGDMHWGNSLDTVAGIRIIDPYGWAGDGAYDLAVFASRLRADHEDALRTLCDGYGSRPERMSLWMSWAVVDAFRLAIRYWPDDVAPRRAHLDRALAADNGIDL